MPTLSDIMHTATDALRAEGVEFTASMRWDSNGGQDGTIYVHPAGWYCALPVLVAAAEATAGASIVNLGNYLAINAPGVSIRCRPKECRPLPKAVAMGGAA